MSDLQSIVEKRLGEIIEVRHRLHQIPELGYEETKTAAQIRGELDRLGIEFVGGVRGAPTATIAMIGDQTRPCVALRADIDALPIQENTGLPYASQHPGRMHACGHDGHAANLVGAAAVLKEIERELPVCVKLIWQPAEENGGGAKKLVDAGVLDGRIGPKVDAIFGLHGWPEMRVGTVSTRPGGLLASMDSFHATFIGQGAHGAYPHLGRDPIAAAAEAVLSLQQIVSREVDPTDSAVVTVGQFHAGTAVNIIPERATIAGTVRALNDETRKKLEVSIRRRLGAAATAGQCQLEFDWHAGYPALVNDPAMADYVQRIVQSALGDNAYIPSARPSMGAEDFAYYLQKVPGCFILIGVAPQGQDSNPGVHTDRYDFTDAALEVGMKLFVELARNYRT